MIDLLIFLIIRIRPNIAFSIIIATFFAKNISFAYIKTIQTIFQYLKRLINLKIIYTIKNLIFLKEYLHFNKTKK